MGQPFMPVRGIIGTGYMHIRSDFKAVENPFQEGEKVVLVPPITPDLAFIHAFKADRKGNLLVDGFENDPLLARASEKVIATCEELVDSREELLACGEGVLIPSLYVTGVVLLEGAARPTACRGYYDLDENLVSRYIEAAKDGEKFNSFLRDFITG